MLTTFALNHKTIHLDLTLICRHYGLSTSVSPSVVGEDMVFLLHTNNHLLECEP